MQNEIKIETTKNWCTNLAKITSKLSKDALCVNKNLKQVPSLGELVSLQLIQQTLQKVIYILNADKNWNNEIICI